MTKILQYVWDKWKPLLAVAAFTFCGIAVKAAATDFINEQIDKRSFVVLAQFQSLQSDLESVKKSQGELKLDAGEVKVRLKNVESTGSDLKNGQDRLEDKIDELKNLLIRGQQ